MNTVNTATDTALSYISANKKSDHKSIVATPPSKQPDETPELANQEQQYASNTKISNAVSKAFEQIDFYA